MILKANHHFLIYPFFQKYSGWIIKKHFHAVEIKGSFEDRTLPILLISNHISWWDGFWAMQLNVKVLKRKFHFMMREDQLQKYRIFNFSGGFSVNKNSRSVLESLNYASGLLKNPENMVLIFPQGEIQSIYKPELEFQKGIEKVLSKLESNQVQILFVANLIDYFTKEKPTLFMYLEEYDALDFSNAGIQLSYNRFYNQCVEKQLNIKV